MERVIIGGTQAYTTKNDPTTLAKGEVGVYYIDNTGAIKVTADGKIKEPFTIIIGGSPNEEVTINGKIKVAVEEYTAYTSYSCKLTLRAPTKAGEYGFILTRKGVTEDNNNERVSVYVEDVSIGQQGLTNALIKALNSKNIEVTASLDVNDLKLTSKVKGIDYTVALTGLANGVKSAEVAGVKGKGDGAKVKDLILRTEGNKSVNYLKDRELNEPLFNKLGFINDDDAYKIYIISWVNDIRCRLNTKSFKNRLYLALPSASEAITGFDKVIKALQG